jgi:hypothetical protein
MKTDVNLSPVDRYVRVTVGVALLGSGVLGMLLDVLGAVLAFSGVIGFCHVYRACGISTAKKA